VEYDDMFVMLICGVLSVGTAKSWLSCSQKPTAACQMLSVLLPLNMWTIMWLSICAWRTPFYT